MIRVQLRISGRVQGVGYRDFVERAAVERGIRGWVRNLADGDVEVLAEGDGADLAAFEKKLRRGPPLAQIVQVRYIDPPSIEPLSRFRIRSTADA